MTHNCPKLERYLFPGISGCIFAPATGSRRILMSRGFRICMAKGGSESKIPGYGRLLISPFPIAGWFSVRREREEKGVKCVLKQVEFVFWHPDLPWSAVWVRIYTITQYFGCSVVFSFSQSGGWGRQRLMENVVIFSVFFLTNSPIFPVLIRTDTPAVAVTNRATFDIKPTLSEGVYWR